MGGEPPKAPYGFVQYCASTVVRSNREWSSQVRNMEGCLGSPAKRLVYSSVHFLCVRVRSYQLGDRRTGTEEMERFCRPLPYHLATRTAETAGLPKPTRSIRPKPRVSAGIFVGTCHQAGALVQLTPGSPQARAPDPIVDLTAGPLEPGLEARVVPHLVVDPRGDEVELLAYGREGVRPFQPRERLLRVAGPRVILRTPRAVIAGLRSEAWGATI